jgi:hypothetical protein
MVARNAEGTARRGFPPWVIVVLTVVLVLAVAAGVSIWYQRNPPTSAAAPSPSTSSAPAAVTGGDIPNGCLAGQSTSVGALIAAQKKAPHTEAGAVGLAAAFSRWMLQYPRPKLADANKVIDQLKSSDADQTITDLPSQLASVKPMDGWASGGLSFADGRYIIEDSSQNRVKVTVGGAEIKNGLPVPDYKVLGTFALAWQKGTWKFQSSSADRTVEDLFTNGAALAGGC